MDYYQIGQRIRRFRRAQGLSQEQLAEQTGISVTHMSHIETGNTKLSLSVFAALAEALHVPADALLRDDPPAEAGDIAREAAALFAACGDRESRILLDTLRALKAALEQRQ